MSGPWGCRRRGGEQGHQLSGCRPLTPPWEIQRQISGTASPDEGFSSFFLIFKAFPKKNLLPDHVQFIAMIVDFPLFGVQPPCCRRCGLEFRCCLLMLRELHSTPSRALLILVNSKPAHVYSCSGLSGYKAISIGREKGETLVPSHSE